MINEIPDFTGSPTGRLLLYPRPCLQRPLPQVRRKHAIFPDVALPDVRLWGVVMSESELLYGFYVERLFECRVPLVNFSKNLPRSFEGFSGLPPFRVQFYLCEVLPW